MRTVKRVQKYTYSMVKICNETDRVYTRCYQCGEWFPSTTEYFKKEARVDRDRDIRPICKKCANEQLKEWMKKDKQKKEIENMREVSKENIQANPLIDEKETIDSKLDKLLAYLGLK